MKGGGGGGGERRGTHFVTPKSIPSVAMYLETNRFSQNRLIRQLYTEPSVSTALPNHGQLYLSSLGRSHADHFDSECLDVLNRFHDSGTSSCPGENLELGKGASVAGGVASPVPARGYEGAL